MREEVERNRELYKTYRPEMLQMGGVKQFYDGVTSSHTAYLKSHIRCLSLKETWVVTLNRREDGTLNASLLTKKVANVIHTVGDEAIELTLKTLKKRRRRLPFDAPNKFNTIEHLEVMDPNRPSINGSTFVNRFG